MREHHENQWLTLQPPGGLKGVFFRFAAVGETLFVLLGLIVAARLIFRAVGFVDADTFLFGDDVIPDFRRAAIAESQWHFVRYGLIFFVIYLIGKARRRHGREAYGLTTGGHSFWELMVFGVGVFAVMHVPSLALRFADHYFDIGPGTPFWALMEQVEWDANFWIYMAVSSFLIVPFVEEIVTRGYMLGRFRESFSPGGALIMVALIFAAAHTQYHKGDLYSIGNLGALIWGSVLMGYTVYRTGSLIPAIIAHGLVNIPTSITVDYFIIGLIFIVLVVFQNVYRENAGRLWAILRSTTDWFSLAIAGAAVVALGLTLEAVPWAPYAWLAGFVSLFLASLFIKSAWSGRG